MKRSVTGIVLVSAVAVFAAGCGSSDSGTETGPGKVKVGGLSEGVIAKVGDREIKRTELDTLLNRSRAQAKAAKQAFPKDGSPQFVSVQRQAVDQLVLAEAIKTEAATCGKACEVPDADVNTRLKQIVSANYQGSQAKFNKFLASIKLTRPEAREIVRQQAQQTRVTDEVGKKVRFTEADASTFYKANKAQYSVPAGRRAFHILVPSRALAQTISAQASAANFAALAKKYGTDSTASRGGDLSPLLVGTGQFVPEFDKAAKALKNGQVSGPIKTQFGWHVVRVVDEKASVRPFDSVKAGIIQEQLATKRQTALQTWQTDLIAKTRKSTTYANADLIPADQLAPATPPAVTTKTVPTPGTSTAASTEPPPTTSTGPATP